MSAYATPTLQVHGVGSVAGSISNDDDTWFLSGATGQLELIATFGSADMKIENAFLVLTTSAINNNPFAGSTKYDSAAAFEATLSGTVQTNNHSPYGLGASQIDTFAYSLGDFTYNAGTATKDCNADIAGTTTCAASAGTGDIKMFAYDYSALALDWVHFDMLAYVTDEKGNSGKWVSTWEINPGSHDTTWKRTSVPETSSLLLLMVGLFGLVGFKRKSS